MARPTSVRAAARDRRHRGREQALGDREDGVRGGRRLRQRVRPGRAREVVEAHAQHDGATDSARGPQAACDAVDDRDQDRVDGLGRPPPAAEGALRPDGAPPAALLHRPRVEVVDEGVGLATGGAAEHRHERRLRQQRGADATDVQALDVRWTSEPSIVAHHDNRNSR